MFPLSYLLFCVLISKMSTKQATGPIFFNISPTSPTIPIRPQTFTLQVTNLWLFGTPRRPLVVEAAQNTNTNC